MATKTKVKKTIKKAQSVQKALAPEEKTVIENIASLAAQLISAGGGDEVTMAEDEMEDEFLEEGDEEEVIKADEGPTANEKAEDRVEDGTEITEGNLSEVGKKVSRSVVRQVNKTLRATQDNTAMMQVLSEITKALKGISDRQSQSETAIGGILDGLGITKSVVKEAGVQKAAATRPVAQTDQTAILAELMSVVKGMQTTQVAQNRPAGWDVAKDNHEGIRAAGPYLLGLR